MTRFHQQDKGYLVNEICGLVTVVGLRLTLARLCGLAFTSGLVSKECVVNVASITSLSILMEFGVIIRTVLTIIYRARILVAMNSMYSTLLHLSIIVGLIPLDGEFIPVFEYCHKICCRPTC